MISPTDPPRPPRPRSIRPAPVSGVGPLDRLVDAARSLPRPPADSTAPARPLAFRPATVAARSGVGDLRRQVGAFLDELAHRLEPALTAALDRAARAWDQADDVVVLDDGLRETCRGLVAAWEAVADRAAAGEALLTIQAAVGLVTLVETRLATLVRLRVRGGGGLLEGGRPFLDVARALAAAARGWR